MQCQRNGDGEQFIEKFIKIINYGSLQGKQMLNAF